MELLDRYLNAVERYLPRAQQADVVAELSDSIQSTVEEQKPRLGRPLSVDEESAIIKTYGHPIMAASRYRPSTAHRPHAVPVLREYAEDHDVRSARRYRCHHLDVLGGD